MALLLGCALGAGEGVFWVLEALAGWGRGKEKGESGIREESGLEWSGVESGVGGGWISQGSCKLCANGGRVYQKAVW